MSTSHNTPAQLIETGKTMARTICASVNYSEAIGDLTLTRTERAGLAAYIAHVELQRDTDYVAVSAILHRLRQDKEAAWLFVAHTPLSEALESLIEAIALHKGMSTDSARMLYGLNKVHNPHLPIWKSISVPPDDDTAVLVAQRNSGQPTVGILLDGKWFGEDMVELDGAYAWTDLPETPLDEEVRAA